jgi:hypothetical protein
MIKKDQLRNPGITPFNSFCSLARYFEKSTSILDLGSTGTTELEIPSWDLYRYNVLPDSLSNHRVAIERMLIRDFSTILQNNFNIDTMNLRF